jgi:hypothetical protein
VSDLNTGLEWEKKTDDSTVHDKDNTYTWSAGSPYGPDGTVFSIFLYALNGATSSNGTDTATACFAGHCDWRLPTIQELQGIVDVSQSPIIDPALGPPGDYWSATTVSDESTDAWVIWGGDLDFNVKTYNFYSARAVRGGL